MEVELAIRSLMDRYDISTHGAIGRLAQRLGRGVQSASRIVNGQVTRLSHDQVSKVCQWLLAEIPEGDPRRAHLRLELPGAIYRFRGPWDRLLSASRLRLFLGERFSSDRSVQDRWLSGSDAEVATTMVHRLTDEGASFTLEWRNVPLHLSAQRPAVIAEDEEKAVAQVEDLERLGDGAALLIGSQLVNLAVEAAVGAVFAVKPFRRAHGQEVPFYMQFRERDGRLRAVSCFGGVQPPPGVRKPGTIGIHYRDGGKWSVFPWRYQKTGAGVVLIEEIVATGALKVVLFGFSGACTRAIGHAFCDSPERFADMKPRGRHSRLGVFAMEVRYGADGTGSVTEVVNIQRPDEVRERPRRSPKSVQQGKSGRRSSRASR